MIIRSMPRNADNQKNIIVS